MDKKQQNANLARERFIHLIGLAQGADVDIVINVNKNGDRGELVLRGKYCADYGYRLDDSSEEFDFTGSEVAPLVGEWSSFSSDLDDRIQENEEAIKAQKLKEAAIAKAKQALTPEELKALHIQ